MISGDVLAFGDSELGQTGVSYAHIENEAVMLPTAMYGMQDSRCRVEEVAVGDHHTVVRLSSGELYACGKNAEGQLGLGATAPYTVHHLLRIEWPRSADGDEDEHYHDQVAVHPADGGDSANGDSANGDSSAS